jgi:AraC-like DNA-binding protein
MNIEPFYILLLCFVSGVTQCLLTLCGIYILLKHRTYQFQRVFAAVLILHGIGFFNNFVVLACHDQPYSEFLNTLLVLFDYVIVGGYMMFGVSLVFPNRIKTLHLLFFEIPYVGAMLLFAFTRATWILTAVQIYTFSVSLALLVYLCLSIKRHTKMLRDNVGNMEYFDLRWSTYLIALFFVVQLVWSIESLSQQSWFSSSASERNMIFDTLYCILIMIVALFVMKRIIKQKVFVMSTEEIEETVKKEPVIVTQTTNSLINSNIEQVILEKRYFQDNMLTLQKLAQHLGTNRQYLSNYINQIKGMTFYDYINDFRLNEAKTLLEGKGTDNQYSLEDISVMSGFNSYATFLRSFKKKFGQTPSQYLVGKKS